ncbi:hypothetical protein TNCV_2194691 [Trichonephila clavipes]|uniref:Uncharacterized protein n=1 Tax=Trichonephila clavipes TaxID=2585209 RepID=A0A8X6SFR9_TRICX|nr:hypothetical protein TNCV_2194691 [Trichonephila clavipes]
MASLPSLPPTSLGSDQRAQVLLLGRKRVVKITLGQLVSICKVPYEKAIPAPQERTGLHCFHAEIVEVEIGGVAIYHPFGDFTELNRTVTCMVLKGNDRRACHDEFGGPRSDYVRQVALETTTTRLLWPLTKLESAL